MCRTDSERRFSYLQSSSWCHSQNLHNMVASLFFWEQTASNGYKEQAATTWLPIWIRGTVEKNKSCVPISYSMCYILIFQVFCSKEEIKQFYTNMRIQYMRCRTSFTLHKRKLNVFQRLSSCCFFVVVFFQDLSIVVAPPSSMYLNFCSLLLHFLLHCFVEQWHPWSVTFPVWTNNSGWM